MCSHVLAGYLVLAAARRVAFMRATVGEVTAAHDVVLVLASLMPDLIDKLRYMSGVASASRSFGHTLVVVMVASLAFGGLLTVVGASRPSSHAAVAAAGMISHLLADMTCGHVPWFWPMQDFRFPSMIHTHMSRTALALIEAASLVFVALHPGLLARWGRGPAAALAVLAWLLSVCMSSALAKGYIRGVLVAGRGLLT